MDANGHPLCREPVEHGPGYVIGEARRRLKPVRVQVHQSRQFGQPHDPPSWQVGHMGVAMEWD